MPHSQRKTIEVRWMLDGVEVHRTVVDSGGLRSIRNQIRRDAGRVERGEIALDESISRYDLVVGPASQENAPGDD